MKLNYLKINGYKNLNLELNNTSSIIALIGNNGSGKSNFLEAVSYIFYHLYNKTEKEITFDFTLEYKTSNNRTVKIEKKKSTIRFFVDNDSRVDIHDILPKQIVAIYSGEEKRLWHSTYEPFYIEYVDNINKSDSSGLGGYNLVPKMLYINKYYWHISLLCLLLSEAPDVKKFCRDTLGIKKVNSIKFDFNKTNYKNYTNSNVKSFIELIDKKNEYKVSNLKKRIESTHTLDEVFKYLYLSFSPKGRKMIEDITIKYNDENLDVEDFSEGEKKMLLIKAALEFASTEDSLIILDEPDAHIHLGNKKEVKNVFKEYLKNRQIILTTHSPTLTEYLDNDSLFMLDYGELISEEKQDILEGVSGEYWNKLIQNAFLASKKPTILLVEGKTDIEHIQNAYETLKDEYPELDFQSFPLNGESKIQSFLSGLYESDFHTNKLYIGIYDNDAAGQKALGKGFAKVEKRKFKLLKENNNKANNSYFAITLPKPKGVTCDCTIETLYETEKFQEALQSATNKAISYLKNKSIDDISKGIKEQAKIILTENSKSFEKKDFKNFRALFDLIKEIQVYRKQLLANRPISSSDKVKSTESEKKHIEIYSKRRNTDLKAHFYPIENKTVIQPESIIATDVVNSFKDNEKKNRMEKMKQHCELSENKWTVRNPIEFSSPSGAIKFGTGSNLNGWKHWKISKNGNNLEIIRNKEYVKRQ